jgi:hypothetical protein
MSFGNISERITDEYRCATEKEAFELRLIALKNVAKPCKEHFSAPPIDMDLPKSIVFHQ